VEDTVALDPMQIKIETDESGATLRLAGTLDYGTILEFREAMLPLLEESYPRITLDMRRVSYLDSAGLNELLCFNRQILKDGKEWVILVTSDYPHRTMHMRQLLAYLPVREVNG
jgi:anti-sigma B factor antagonist